MYYIDILFYLLYYAKKTLRTKMKKTKKEGSFARQILLIIILFTCSLLNPTKTFSQQAQSFPPKKRAVMPDYSHGWIYIGLFDSITGAQKKGCPVVIVDTTGSPVKNISDIKKNNTYILRQSQNGLWVEPPGIATPNKKGYLEVKKMLGANTIIRVVSDVYISKERYYPNWYWVEIVVLNQQKQ